QRIERVQPAGRRGRQWFGELWRGVLRSVWVLTRTCDYAASGISARFDASDEHNLRRTLDAARRWLCISVYNRQFIHARGHRAERRRAGDWQSGGFLLGGLSRAERSARFAGRPVDDG